MDDEWVFNIKCKIQKLNLFFKLIDEKYDKIKEIVILFDILWSLSCGLQLLILLEFEKKVFKKYYLMVFFFK